MNVRMQVGMPGSQARAAAFLLCLSACALLLTGCMFRDLKRNLTRLDGMSLIGGRVSWDDEASPLVVLLLTGATDQVVDTYSLIKPGAYYFVIPEGTYRIAAFVDHNHDFTYQPDREPAAFFESPADVQVTCAREARDINIHVARETRSRLGIPTVVMMPGKRGTRALPDMHLGEIVKIDDSRFCIENGKMGLWTPVDFLFRVGAGVYFLEAYDPRKTPVLFIHGADGNPSDWKYLIERLDRSKFQPWLVYYPSGLNIDVTARAIARWTETLGARYGSFRLVVVAHSLGGLVARATINRMTEAGGGKNLAAFVTLSTPWAGHAAAETGVEHAPVAVPLWHDMVPGSPFLARLFKTPLPSHCSFHLLFSYNGQSRFINEPNDGYVALSSELSPGAQQVATRIYGLNEDHISILRSQETSRILNAILAEALHVR